MAYIPMDISPLQRVQAPRADVLGSLLDGQKMATQQQALAGLSDPMDRYNLLFGNTPKQYKPSVFAQRQGVLQTDEVKTLLAKYNEISEEAIKLRMENPDAPIADKTVMLNALAQEYQRLTQMKLPNEMTQESISDIASQRKMIQGEKEFGITSTLNQKKFNEQVRQNFEKELVDAVAKFDQRVNPKFKVLEVLENMNTFVPEAKAGSPVARKNLLAAASRLGSNEALSDQEMTLVRNGNFGEMLQGFANKIMGSGASISGADVKSAIGLLNSVIPIRVSGINTIIDEAVPYIVKQVGLPANEMSNVNVKERLTRGRSFPSTEPISLEGIVDKTLGSDNSNMVNDAGSTYKGEDGKGGKGKGKGGKGTVAEQLTPSSTKQTSSSSSSNVKQVGDWI